MLKWNEVETTANRLKLALGRLLEDFQADSQSHLLHAGPTGETALMSKTPELFLFTSLKNWRYGQRVRSLEPGDGCIFPTVFPFIWNSLHTFLSLIGGIYSNIHAPCHNCVPSFCWCFFTIILQNLLEPFYSPQCLTKGSMNYRKHDHKQHFWIWIKRTIMTEILCVITYTQLLQGFRHLSYDLG